MSAIICQCLPSSVNVCHHLSMSAIVCQYCRRLSMSFIICLPSVRPVIWPSISTGQSGVFCDKLITPLTTSPAKTQTALITIFRVCRLLLYFCSLLFVAVLLFYVYCFLLLFSVAPVCFSLIFFSATVCCSVLFYVVVWYSVCSVLLFRCVFVVVVVVLRGGGSSLFKLGPWLILID